MKKLAAILLLSVHLFNLAGYSLLFQCLIHQSDAQLVKQLDNSSYNDKDLLEIKVPLNMPYISDSKDFERVNGQLEYNGVQYNYVKRKVTADTLYVLCFPNIPKTQLYKAKAIYGKEVSDIPTNKKPSESLKKQSCASEYNCTANQYAVNGFADVSAANCTFVAAGLSNHFIPIPEQPPKTLC